MNKNFYLSSYTFDLPDELIAQSPAEKRDCSRLLVYSKEKGQIEHTIFKNIADFLPQSNDGKKPLFIANNSKVIPARLLGESPNKGKRELLLLTPVPILEEYAKNFRDDNANKTNLENAAIGEVLLKPSRSAKVGDIWEFGGLKVEILEKNDFGRHKVNFYWNGSLTDFFEQNGHLPLPPYIKRTPLTTDDNKSTLSMEQDKSRYQTVYANADKAGSSAAPTAGLHFTQELKDTLLTYGCDWAEVTLHVGYGTFTPVRTADIREHEMHSEYFELSAKTAQAILQAKKEQRPIIAVGTTSCRVLEGASELWAGQDGNILPHEGISGTTNIFIYPDKNIENTHAFNVVDALITNFHLPESSLLMLVSAFVGREELLRIYAEAVRGEYRFFSYGDAMLIF